MLAGNAYRFNFCDMSRSSPRRPSDVSAVLNLGGVHRPDPDILRARLQERDSRIAGDTRTDAQRWRGDPPPDRRRWRSTPLQNRAKVYLIDHIEFADVLALEASALEPKDHLAKTGFATFPECVVVCNSPINVQLLVRSKFHFVYLVIGINAVRDRLENRILVLAHTATYV